jgi:ABC-2 type transport system permease protein
VSRRDRTLPVLQTNMALFVRDPGPLIGRIVQPILLVLLLQPLYTAAMGDRVGGAIQLVLGHLVLFSLLGMSIVGTSILTERRWCTFDRLRASPARAPELLAGKAIPILGFLLLQQAVVLSLGVMVLGVRVSNYGLLLVADLVWALTVLCIGAALAVLVNSFAQLSATIDIGSTVVAGLSGALVPLATMPSWAQTIAPIWPAYWAMTSLRSAVDGDPYGTLASSAVLGCIAAGAATIAAVRLARGWGRNTLL